MKNLNPSLGREYRGWSVTVTVSGGFLGAIDAKATAIKETGSIVTTAGEAAVAEEILHDMIDRHEALRS